MEQVSTCGKRVRRALSYSGTQMILPGYQEYTINRFNPRTNDLDAGLLVLRAIVPAGLALSRRLMAEVCNCSQFDIEKIETKALAKLRRRLDPKEVK